MFNNFIHKRNDWNNNKIASERKFFEKNRAFFLLHSRVEKPLVIFSEYSYDY